MRKNILTIAVLCGAVVALAQSVAPPVTGFSGVGTRSSGLADNYTAIANDFTAVYWNPAGLAFTPFREIQVSLAGMMTSETSTLNGTASSINQQRVKVSNIGWLRSVPTSKGGFSFALGYTSPVMLDDLRRVTGTDRSSGIDSMVGSGAAVNIRKIERSTFGDLGNWTAGVGWQVAPGVGFGFSLALVTGHETRNLEGDVGYRTIFGDSLQEDWAEQMMVGYLGYDIRIGLLTKPTEMISIGARIELPRYVLASYNETLIDPATDESFATYTYTDTLYTPARAALGICANLPMSTLTADITVRSPAAGHRQESAMGHWKAGAGVGVEVPATFMSTVFRAGYAWQQFELSSMVLSHSVMTPSVDSDAQGHRVSAGATILIGSVALEGSYGYSWWRFSSRPDEFVSTVDEKHGSHRGMLSFSLHY